MRASASVRSVTEKRVLMLTRTSSRVGDSRATIHELEMVDVHPGVVTECCEQLDLGAVLALRPPDRLTVDRDPDEVCSYGVPAVIGIRLRAPALPPSGHRTPPPDQEMSRTP